MITHSPLFPEKGNIKDTYKIGPIIGKISLSPSFLIQYVSSNPTVTVRIYLIFKIFLIEFFAAFLIVGLF